MSITKSTRENIIFMYITQGFNHEQIAEKTNLSKTTIGKVLRANVDQRLLKIIGIKNRIKANNKS